MTSVTLQNQKSIIPDLPRDHKITDINGQLTAAYLLFLDQFILSLQKNLTPEGYLIPQQDQSNISMLNNSSSNYKILYDLTNNQFSGNLINLSSQQWCPFATILNYAGNPNTPSDNHLAGNFLQFCWDTTDNKLYICTTTGTTSSAIWTAT